MTPGRASEPPASGVQASDDFLPDLREEFPHFRIWREIIGERVRYIARGLYPGVRPHTVVTADPAELRAELEPSRYQGLVPFRPGQPSVARMYDFLLDGKDHLPSDRAAAGEILREFPEIAQIARANRVFQARAVRHIAGRGVIQFIDLGAGLPSPPNTHDSARQVTGNARVAYVDNDLVVIAHARALLAVDDQITVVAADIRDPGTVLADPALTALIDLAQPVCVLLTPRTPSGNTAMTGTGPPPAAGASPPAAAGDDAGRWQAAARLRREHPGWVVLWIARKHSYRAWPLFRAPRGTALTAPTPQAMAGQMDRVEHAAGRPRARSRPMDT